LSQPNQSATSGVVIVSWTAKPLKWIKKKMMHAYRSHQAT